MPNRKTTGYRLKQYMNDRNLKQVDILNRIEPLKEQYGMKFGKNDLSQYVNDKVEPRQDKIFVLAKALNVDEAWLMGYDVPIHGSEKQTRDSSKTVDSYNFFDTGIAAGQLETIDPFFADDVEKIELPSSIMGKYAGSEDIFVSRINGDSMNKVLPDQSIIAIKRFNDVEELKDGDIVVFNNEDGYSVKRFFNDDKSEVYVFKPESNNSDFRDIIVRHESASELEILGKVVVYVVEL